MALPDARSTLIDLAFHTCMWVSGFRARPAGSFTWDPTLWWYLLIQKISRVSPAAGGTAHTSYICPSPIRPINGFWLYQFIKLISSEGVMHLWFSQNEIQPGQSLLATVPVDDIRLTPDFKKLSLGTYPCCAIGLWSPRSKCAEC